MWYKKIFTIRQFAGSSDLPSRCPPLSVIVGLAPLHRDPIVTESAAIVRSSAGHYLGDVHFDVTKASVFRHKFNAHEDTVWLYYLDGRKSGLVPPGP